MQSSPRRAHLEHFGFFWSHLLCSDVMFSSNGARNGPSSSACDSLHNLVLTVLPASWSQIPTSSPSSITEHQCSSQKSRTAGLRRSGGRRLVGALHPTRFGLARPRSSVSGTSSIPPKIKGRIQVPCPVKSFLSSQPSVVRTFADTFATNF